MNNADFMIALPQFGDEMYPLDEALKLLEPIYAQHNITIKRCITGLTNYAAELASAGQAFPIPNLRDFITDMAQFWVLNDDYRKTGPDSLVKEYGGAFDQAVAQGKASSNRPALSGQGKADIVAGLRLYAKEMLESGGMEQYAAQCRRLETDLIVQWAEQSEQGMEMGGMA